MAYAEFTGELDAPERGFVPFDGELDKEPGGFVASAKQSIGAAIRGAGQAAADFIPGVSQDNPVKRYGQEVIEANPTAVNSFADIADKPGTAVAEATGNAAGSMAGIVGARAIGMGITAAAPLTGPAAPITAAIGQIVAWVGPAAIAALPSFGSIRDKQMLSDPQTEDSAKAKAIAALGAGTVGLIESKFGPQQWAMAALTREGRAQLAKKFAETGILKGLGYGAAKGAAVEGAEELVQNPIEQAASFQDPTTPQNLKETAFGGAMGAIGGGVLGGGTGVAVNLMPQKTAQDILAAPDIDSAIQTATEVLALPAPGANQGETILATERGTAGTAAQFDMLRRQADVREAGGGMGRNADITDVEAKAPAAPIANDPAALLDRQNGDPLAPMVEDRRIRTEAQDALAREAEQRKAAEMEAIPELATEQNAVQAALARAGTLEAPTAMELALQRARGAQAPAPAPAAAPVDADTPQLPRIVERTPEMVAMPQKLAEQRAAASGGEVVRIQNQSGKFAFTVTPKAADVSNSVEAPGAVPSGVDGRGADVGGGQPAGGLGDGGRGAAAEPGRSGAADVAVGRGAQQPGAVEPQATWFGRRGDGYLTEGDAQMAIPSRQRVNPDLRWAVERMPSGKFRLAGYAQESAPVVAVARRAEPVAPQQPEPVAVKTPETMPAVNQRLFVQRGSQRFEVGSLQEAAQKWMEFRDQTGEGVSAVGNGVRVVDQDGKEVARIAYNGNVFPAGEWKPGVKPLLEANNVTRALAPPAEAKPADQRLVPVSKRESATSGTAQPTERERINTMVRKSQQRRDNLTPNPFKTFLIRNGIALRLAREFAPGTRERLAMGRTFRNGGLELDALAERAAEQGYIRDRMDTDELYALIAKVASGERVAPMYGQDAEAEMAAIVDRQRALEEDAAEAVAALPDETRDVLDDVPWDEPSNVGPAEAMRALGFSEQEIRDATATGQDRAQEAGAGDRRAVEAAGGQAQADSGQGPGPAREEGLTAPTPADVIAQQDQREAEQQRRDEGGDKPAPVRSPTRDQIDLLNPQGGIFDAPVAPEAAAQEGKDEIDQRIEAAQKAGVTLSDADKAEIRATLEKAAELNRKAGRTSSLASDPLNKGNAFPMGVGFTRETKRSNQRIDASVRRAGEAVVIWKKAEQAEKYAEALLAGKNTEADKLKKAAKREEYRRALVGKLVNWQKGDKIGAFTIERVNKDRDGYPASYTISGDGIVKGVQDKVDVVREFFDGDKDGFRAMVDAARATLEDVPQFSLRDQQEDASLPYEEVEQIVDELTAKWQNRPDIRVLDSMSEAPPVVLKQYLAQRSQGTHSRVHGFHLRGTVYIVADEMTSRENVQEVLFHEALGHYGMRELFGDMLKPMLADVLLGQRAQVKAKAKAYGLDMNKQADRLMAAEEVLAELAQTRPEMGVIRRLVAAIRTWLRDNIPSFAKMKMTDDELIRKFIIPARGFVERGQSPRPTFTIMGDEGPETVFSLGDNPSVTDSAAFRKWFGDSKVVDSEGKPLVVYHGTTRDFDAFDDSKRAATRLKIGDSKGLYFTGDAQLAAEYAGVDGANVMPVYLSMQNPKIVPTSMHASYFNQRMIDQLRADGHDGVIYKGEADGFGSEYVVFEPTKVKSAIGNNGNFDPEDNRVQFSLRSAVTNKVLPKTWQAPDESKLDDFIYTVQDKHIDTKRAVQAVRDAIGAIADEQDPYLQEELFHGRAAMATKEFLEKQLRPLLVEMQARGVEMSDFEEYLHNRHAERRNVQVAKVNPKMQDGGSGIKTADARAYLAGLPAAKRKAYEALAKRVEAINRDTRKLLVSSGLEKQSTIDAWEAAYGDEYVPLMREEMDDGTTGIGQGYSVRGSASKRAMGSDKPVANIIANIALQRERTITRAEKKRIGEALYGLVLKAPNDEFWFAIDPQLSPSNVMATQMQLIAMGLDPADAESIAQEPKSRYVDKATGLVTERINPALRGMDNVLAVRIDGEDKFVFFNKEDPRAMRMVTALKNLDADQLGTVMGTVAKMTRWFASVNTQFNPVFGVTNITRDVQTALLNLSSTPLKNHRADVLKHTLSALRGIYIDLRDHRAGKQPSSVWAGLFEEFQREGGATGYRDMYANAQERADQIASELRAVNDGTAMKLGKGIMGWLSDYNETMENSVRLAAYKVGKEQGLSNQQAASLAKNLTVNFNRKGQVALQVGALYAFFNASTQGMARMGQTMFEGGKLSATGRKILAGGLLLGSMQALLLAAAGYDDDEPPDFVRERALVLPVGGGKYVAIPMPLGFHVIPNLGRIPTEWALGGFKDTTKYLAQIVDVASDAFNPIGSAGLSLQTIAPTVIDPLAALSENRDWTGKPIAKKDFDANRPTAGHTRAKDTATPWAKMISYGINIATGGTDYKPGMASPTPDQIDYLIGQVTGGVGRELSKAAQVVESGFSGEELPMHKIPLVGRFVGTTEGQAAEASRFYDNLREIGAHKVEIDGLRRDKRGAEVAGYIRENKEARLIEMATSVQRQVSEMQKRKRELIKNGASRERIKLMDQQITARMRALNLRVQKLEEQGN